LIAQLAMTSGTEKGVAATPRSIRRTYSVTAALVPQIQQVEGHVSPPSSLLLEARRRRASWRARRKRKGVKQVLKLFDFADSLRRREDGQTMAEYGVVLAVITIAVFAALGLLSGAIVDAIDSVTGVLS
jgi:Flp pilus assembly pilin Flp